MEYLLKVSELLHIGLGVFGLFFGRNLNLAVVNRPRSVRARQLQSLFCYLHRLQLLVTLLDVVPLGLGSVEYSVLLLVGQNFADDLQQHRHLLVLGSQHSVEHESSLPVLQPGSEGLDMVSHSPALGEWDTLILCTLDGSQFSLELGVTDFEVIDILLPLAATAEFLRLVFV
uniref:Uncharacterized protein n=1 Tax=Strombidium inclinatum TaxID=197538 RepID=A0A7S3N2L6_9SPIT